MASKDEAHPSKQEPRLGGRIDVVEDEDFSLLLDLEPAAPAAAPAPAPAAAKPVLPASPTPAVPAPAAEPSTDRTSRIDVLAEPAPELLMSGASVREVPAAEPVAARIGASTEAEKEKRAETPAEPVPDFKADPAASPAGATAAPGASPFSPPPGATVRLPLIGNKPLQKQIRILLGALAGSLLLGAVLIVVNNIHASMASAQTQVAGDALMHSQRIGKATPNAMQGNAEAFKQLEESRREVNADLDQLARGGTWQGMEISRPSSAVQAQLKDVRKLWERSDRAADTILKMKKELTGFGQTLQKLNGMTPVLLDMTEQIASAKVQGGAPAREISAASQLSLLTQRLARSTNEFMAAEGISPETAFLLGKDVNTFRDIVDGFLRGSEVLRLAPTKEGEVRERLHKLQTTFDEYRGGVAGILSNMPRFVEAKQSEQLIFSENEAIKQRLSALQQTHRAEQDALHWSFWLLLACITVGLASGAGIAILMLQESRQRAAEAEQRRQQAEEQRILSQKLEADARATNAQTQAAILRLMDELQKVADGDLTVQATVTEDITGAIADSVNYTVEELRGLVGRVSGAADQLAAASTTAQNTSNALLAATHQQARDIAEIGQSVLAMAVQTTDVSRAAVESADVARMSVQAAHEGQTAVGNTIAGMQEIRGHIQETAKRIKRLGESSQEIGEITELISDITEQTNVLALNAAIQAASAGEAGRGFSIVAEEVQRLAERSAAATKQIGALVRAIQNDTFDAVAAMERSTQGVVEGARLSDAAGTALAEILRVSNRLAELIHDISAATEQQATSANGVAQSIHNILGVTEKTQEGTQQTAQSIRELAQLARELKESVTRFRVA